MKLKGRFVGEIMIVIENIDDDIVAGGLGIYYGKKCQRKVTILCVGLAGGGGG